MNGVESAKCDKWILALTANDRSDGKTRDVTNKKMNMVKVTFKYLYFKI